MDDLTQERRQASHANIIEALHGRLTEHHCFLLKVHLAQIDTLEQAVADVEARIGERLVPFQRAAELLNTIPGVSHTVARVLIPDIGIDMSRFPTARHSIP